MTKGRYWFKIPGGILWVGTIDTTYCQELINLLKFTTDLPSHDEVQYNVLYDDSTPTSDQRRIPHKWSFTGLNKFPQFSPCSIFFLSGTRPSDKLVDVSIFLCREHPTNTALVDLATAGVSSSIRFYESFHCELVASSVLFLLCNSCCRISCLFLPDAFLSVYPTVFPTYSSSYIRVVQLCLLSNRNVLTWSMV